MMAKWIPTRGHLKKKRRDLFFLPGIQLCDSGHAGGYLSHIIHEAASLWIKGQYASTGRRKSMDSDSLL